MDAVTEINKLHCRVDQFDYKLPTIKSTLQVTAILEACRRSIDNSTKVLFE